MRRALIVGLAAACLCACESRWMTPAQVAAATKACEDAGWVAVLLTHQAGQYVICQGTEEAP